MSFCGDQVTLKTDRFKYGSVLSTNFVHSDGNTEQILHANPHNIHVKWYPSGKEEIILNDKVVLNSRLFLPGNMVRKINENEQNQFGFCTNIHKYCTLKIVNTDKIIENISSGYLARIRKILVNSMVFYKSWVGIVKYVSYMIKFASKDGSIFTMQDPSIMDFIYTSSDGFTEEDNLFYYGQKLKIRLDDLKKLQFIKRSKLMACYLRNNNYQNPEWIFVYVLNVILLEVQVNWRSKLSFLVGSENTHPGTIFIEDNLENLKENDKFNNTRHLFLGDTHWYKIKDDDNLITMEELRTKNREFNNTEVGPLNNKMNTGRGSQNVINQNTNKKKQFKKQKNRKNTQQSKIQRYRTSTSKSQTFSFAYRFKLNRLNMYRSRIISVTKGKQFKLPKVSLKPNSCVVVKIIYTTYLVDVLWQDGTVETGISSFELYPEDNLELENFPGDLVVELRPSLNDYGVIECVNRVDRTARVQWFKNNPKNNLLLNPTEKTNMSVYEFCHHPYYNLGFGSFIIYYNTVYQDMKKLSYGLVLHNWPDGNLMVLLENGEKKLCSPQSLTAVWMKHNPYKDYEDQSDDSQSEEDSIAFYSIVELQPQNQKLGEGEVRETLINHNQLDICRNMSGSKFNVDDDKNDINIDTITKLPTILEVPTECEIIDNSEEAGDECRNMMSVSEFNVDDDDNIDINMDVKNIETTTKLPLMLETPTECERIAKSEEAGDECRNMMSVSEFNVDDDDNIDINMDVKNIETTTKLPLMLETPTECERIAKSEEAGDECRNMMSVSEFNVDDDDNIDINMDVKNIETTTKLPLMLETPTECERIAKSEEAGVFEMLEIILDNSHMFMNDKVHIKPLTLKAISKDIVILKNSLPSGIWVKTFENHMDLFSVMIRGPEKTPYAGGLFMFDFKIPFNYPESPPLGHYYSYCNDRLNPNLYENGKVCLSLLGTWHGEGSEIWLPNKSNLLQILVSIQGLILVSEPYFNEPGSEIQHGQKLLNEYSRVYNERILLKVIESMINILTIIKLSITSNYFINEITEHVTFHGPKLINSIRNWIKVSENELSEDDKLDPGFPLLPLSKGFCLAIEKPLQEYFNILVSMKIMTN